MDNFRNNTRFLYHKYYHITPILEAWEKIKYKGKFYIWLEYHEWDSNQKLIEDNMHEILIFDPDKKYPEHRFGNDIMLTLLFEVKDIDYALKII